MGSFPPLADRVCLIPVVSPRAWGSCIGRLSIVRHLLLTLTHGALCSLPSLPHGLSSSSVLELSLWSLPQLQTSVPTHSLHSGQRMSLKRPAWWICPSVKLWGASGTKQGSTLTHGGHVSACGSLCSGWASSLAPWLCSWAPSPPGRLPTRTFPPGQLLVVIPVSV